MDEAEFAKGCVDFLALKKEFGEDYGPNPNSDHMLHNYTEGEHFVWRKKMNNGLRKLEKGETSKLTWKHVEILDTLGFPWARSSDDKWYSKFNALKAFFDENGHCDVRRTDPIIGKWVDDQRRAYKCFIDGTECTRIMTRVRIDKLESIGFKWSLDNGTKWDQNYEKLLEYAEEHEGSCDVPTKYDPDPQLASWVQRQRTNKTKQKKNGEPMLSEEQIQKLDDIGFKWQIYKKANKNRKNRKPMVATHVIVVAV